MTTTVENYNAAEHLIDIRDKQGNVKKYYPAAWRLYELSLRYPNANFASEIVHLDAERDFVVVKARLYLGPDYAASDKKAEAFKQGKLTMLDKIETAAKARAARDFGIGTEHALDFEDATVDAPVAATTETSDQATTEPSTVATDLDSIKADVKALGLVRNPAQWTSWKKGVLKKDIADNALKSQHIGLLKGAVEQERKRRAENVA